MAKKKSQPAAGGGAARGGGVRGSRGSGGAGGTGVSKSLGQYFEQSQQPLQILFFLVPMLIFYEVGTRLWARTPEGRIIPVEAYARLNRFFDLTGLDSAGWYLPGLALVVTLIIWHVMTRKAWEINLAVAGGMVLECVALALPLFVFDQLLSRVFAGNSGVAGLAGPVTLSELDWKARLVLSIGAGLYEELLFRLLFLTLAHVVLVNMLGAKAPRGMAVAVVLSALAFMMYHDVTVGLSGPTDWRLVIFYMVFGVYAAGVLLTRGFGIVVGAHAAYDILVLIVLPALRG